MKHAAVLAVLVTAWMASVSQAAVLSALFVGNLNATTLNFLSLAPAPSAGTPRAFEMYINFDDTGILTGVLRIGGVNVDTFGAASGWSVNDSGSNDLLTVTAQSGVNATKFLQFSMSGGNVTAVATNALPTLSALLTAPSTPTSLAFGNIGSGALGYAGTITSVPEPATMGLLAFGAAIGGWRMRRKKVQA